MLILKYCTFKFIIVLLLSFSPIRCQSGEIVVGQADFSSPPERLSCKVWETFLNSDTALLEISCHGSNVLE